MEVKRGHKTVGPGICKCDVAAVTLIPHWFLIVAGLILGAKGVLSSAQATGGFCTPLAPPAMSDRFQIIRRGDVGMLRERLHKAVPGVTLLLEPGVYRLGRGESIEVSTLGVVLRGLSGRREDTIIEGGNINVAINADNVMIADMTLKNARFHSVQVRGERGVTGTRFYNLHLLDAGQQFIKVSTGDGLSGRFADDGEVACSLIEYSDFSRGTDVSPPTYTNAIDILAGKGWIVRDNLIRRIRSQAGPAGPAILVWKNSQDTVIKRNIIIDSWRGIALGLMPADRFTRGGANVDYDHQNGLVENNVILAINEPADAAIENNYALNSRILHNTVYYNPRIQHTVSWSIEYRFPPTTVEFVNNLANRPIVRRRPYPLRMALQAGNITNAQEAWFEDVSRGDFHLRGNNPAIDRGVREALSEQDFDGDKRPQGTAPDPGADEHIVIDG